MATEFTSSGKLGYLDFGDQFRERTQAAMDQMHKDAEPLPRFEKKLYDDGRFWPYDGLMTRDAYFRVSWLLPLLCRRRRLRVLDVGCGYGRYAPFFATFDLAAYLGVDSTDARIGVAIARHSDRAGKIAFSCMDVLDDVRGELESSEHSFDLVFCSTVMQHLLHRQKLALLAFLKRMCTKTGYIALVDDGVTDKDPDMAYLDPGCAPHMVPIARETFTGAMEPWNLVSRPGAFAGIQFLFAGTEAPIQEDFP